MIDQFALEYIDTGIDSDNFMYADRIDTDAGTDIVNGDADPEDDYGHGSHVAGIAAGIDLLDKAFPLARKAEIRYLRPASGAIRGRAKVAASDSERVIAELACSGRSELGVAVSLSDANGKTVAEMDVDYAFRAFKSREK